VNDAAALQQADVGIAVHGGSTASLIAADVFLTREGLTPIAGLLGRAHRTMRVIRRNLGFSLAYNVFGAALAMSGLVDPLVAAIAMPLSSLTVVLSSIAQHDVFDLQ
jgi:Cu2+-exporting ATPase